MASICSRLFLAGVAVLAWATAGAQAQAGAQLKSCLAAGPDKKIDACTPAIDGGRLTPREMATALNLRGLDWLGKGELKRAHGDFEAAIRSDPEDAWGYDNRGVAHQKMGEIDAALADFDSAIRLKPKFALALADRGAARLANGDVDRAIADLDAALALNPPQPEVALKTRGDARMAKGEYAAAIVDFDAAIKRRPDYAGAYNGRAYARFCLGAFDAAAADFILARQYRTDAESGVGLVIASLRGGHDGQADLEEARKGLDAAKEMPPGLALFGGALSPEQTLQTATDANPKIQRRRACSANFQVGEWYLMQLDTARARLHLNMARVACDKSAPEYSGAVAELARLN
jgi:tetratricopeptide (TPR) repeat protein